MTDGLSAKDRDALISIVKQRARQAKIEADTRRSVLYTEVIDEMTAMFAADDALWADAVALAADAMEKANAHIRDQCALLGIAPDRAPQLRAAWTARVDYGDRERRAELRKLAETRLDALTKSTKAEIDRAALTVTEQLVLGGLASDEARAVLERLPTAETLMPMLRLEDLGVTGWQPPPDVVAQLTTPLTPAQRRRRIIRRAIEAHPTASDRAIAQLAGCDHKTVAAVRRGEVGGEFPALSPGGGEFPALPQEGE